MFHVERKAWAVSWLCRNLPTHDRTERVYRPPR